MNSKLLRQLSLFLKKQSPSLFSKQKCFPFSTITAKSSHSFDDVVPGTSAVYSNALKFQRPASIDWRQLNENKASFIGTVTRQPKTVNWKKGNFGVFTVLKVSSSRSRSNGPDCSSSSSPFSVVLMMRNDLAEFALNHLKENDFVYVSGCLGSYTKLYPSGNIEFNYKLVVKELDFVAQKLGHESQKKLESMEAEAEAGIQNNQNRLSGIQNKQNRFSEVQNNQNRLYLWQVFFSNPYEWWDCRKCKRNPKQPDFKHKDTGEALWLNEYDPPWVKKQLELLESKISGGVLRRPSRISTWVYDE